MFHSNGKAIIAIISVCISGAVSSGPTTRSLESEPFFCYEASNCGDCVLNGCSWAAGQCLDSCGDIADVDCYDHAVFPNLNSQQICAISEEADRNHAICDAQNECGSCTSTKLSNGVDSCFWHPEWNSCKPLLSDAWTMGTDVCFTDPEDERCFLAGTFGCHSCVEDGCGWFAGECIATCDTIADATCYSTETFTGIPVDGICQEAFVDEEDHRLCSDHDSCSTCTSTLKSDGKTPCQWYTDEESGMNWCGTGGCDFLGRCGADTCNEPSPRSKTLAQSVQKLVEKPKSTSCQALASCSDCMASSGGCAWVAGSCQDSCDEIADAACYTLSAFPSMVADDICFMAKEEVYNQQHCGGAGNCLDCTNTVMADGESKCSWFTDEQNNGWCGTPGCDMNGICGSSDSSICADPLIKNGNAKGESHKKHSILGLFLP